VTPDVRQRVEEIFEAALDLPPSGRRAYVDSATDGDERIRGEVHALLAAHGQADGVLERELPPPPTLRPDERLGPYRLVGELGRGGMGVVYAAERDDGQFRRRVAIKVLRSDAGPSLEARVVAERQILASLDHPNIARLLDGGVTRDGRPFLVMEHVDGLPIDVYADRMRLTVDERLRLFMTVAHAVQHAHRNLVVHRDLKPSNILVTSRGEVKLLDFGIAKLMNPALGPAESPHTAEQRALTPEFASPEQIRGEPLNTASDVYSLGVVLYRLLTGRHPYEFENHSMQSIVDVVTNREPVRPSDCLDRPPPPGGDASEQCASNRRTSPERLRRRLRGDLDAIVLRALRKEPADRHGSAELLAQDLELHLVGLPVSARKGARGYRMRSFLRRHRYEVLAAVIVLLSLLGGAGAATWQATVAGVERDRAEDALRQSEEVTGFVMDLFTVSDPGEARLDEITAGDLMRRGRNRVEALSSEPLVQARMYGVIGELHTQLGQYEEAAELLRRALAGKMAALGTQDPETAQAMNQLGLAYNRRALYDEARALHEEALRIQRATLGPGDPAVAATIMHLARLEFDLRARDTLLRTVVEIEEQALGPDDAQVTNSLMTLANNARGLGHYDESVRLLRRALEARERTFGPENALTAMPMLHLGDVLYEYMGEPEEAERLFRRALGILQRQLGENDLTQIHGLHSLGDLLSRQGRFEEGQALLHRAIRILSASLGTRHPRTVGSELHLAGSLMRQRRFAEAEELIRDVSDVWTTAYGPEHPSVGTATLMLGQSLAGQRRFDEAEDLVRRAREIRANALGERSLMIGLTLTDLGDVVRQKGDIDRARSIYREGREILLEHLEPEHPQVQDIDLRLQALDVPVTGPSTAGAL
jgi:serine/threonine protein kinase